MEKVANMLTSVFYLATTDGDQPRVRPFDSICEYNGKIYFETSVNKKVYEQLAINPKFELFTMNEKGMLRLTGVAVQETDEATVKTVEDMIGKYLEDPTLAVFRIDNAHAVITGADGVMEEVDI